MEHRRILIAVVGVLAALALRYPLLPIETYDYRFSLSEWYAFIVENGYFAALQYDFSNYNVPYLYLLAAMAALLPGLHSLVAIKAISMFFDFALAYFVYKCVEHRHRDSATRKSVVPILAGLATLFAPTIVLNSAAWAQADAIYTTFLVACLYFLLAGRQAVALVAFGLAVSFKVQAVFLAPLFLWLIVKGQLRWRHLAWVPLVYLATAAPAGLIGRPWGDLLSIYMRQADVSPFLSMGFPNLYVWIPEQYYDWWPQGVVFTACVALLVAVVVYRSAVRITAEMTVFLAAYSVLVMPYLLPKMHDRYYFPADVIGIVLAFYLPRYWYVPVVIGTVSVLLYARYLTYQPSIPYEHFVPLELLAFAPAALIVALSWQLYTKLKSKQQGAVDRPHSAASNRRSDGAAPT